MSTVFVKNFSAPEICEKEVLRYAGCNLPDATILDLMHACVEEAEKVISYKVCYCMLPLKITGKLCDFGAFVTASENLAKNLEGCGSALLFGATVGTGIDRLIAKYNRISPTKAVMMQAIGSERVEALCDAFCREYQSENNALLKSRFSVGYGDLPLAVQKEVFAVLDCPRKIGIGLNDSLIMSPSKSVTAFVGIKESLEREI